VEPGKYSAPGVNRAIRTDAHVQVVRRRCQQHRRSCGAARHWRLGRFDSLATLHCSRILAAAAASGDVRDKLWLKACGPMKVIRGTDYSYTVVLTNISKTTFRRVELAVIHYDPITRSSIPYRREARPEYAPMYAAAWTLSKFKPGQSFRVGIRLPFEQHNNPKGSNIAIEARAQGPSDYTQLTKDVFFIRRPS
jgi:hypothetical protein